MKKTSELFGLKSGLGDVAVESEEECCEDDAKGCLE